MRTRTRFVALFAVQSLLAAVVSVIFVLRAMGTEYSRAEAEFRIPEAVLLRARDPLLPERERLDAALSALASSGAATAASRVFRTHAIVETAREVGVFIVAGSALTALLFALVARSLTRRLDELSRFSLAIASDRSLRFPDAKDGEFGPVFDSINAMLDTIAAQQFRLGEAARLEGWREVSSFLFHQLRSPLSGLEFAARNVALAAEKGRVGALGERPALELCARSAGSARLECERLRSLLDRFRDLSGLSMGKSEALTLTTLLGSCMERLQPGKAVLDFEGDSGPVAGDRRMLEEAFMNLVLNIVEACPAPPALVKVRSLGEGSDFLRVEFTDANGPVDPDMPAKAGRDRFSTKVDGTGLGLLFVRRVAVLHGGRFEAFLGPDGGFGARMAIPRAGRIRA